MRKLFDTRKRLLATGLVGALIVALALVGGLWLTRSHSAEAQVIPFITIKHVNPDGSDFLGNPFCPQTVWSADGKAKVVSVDPYHDCNNAAGQDHIIRTEDYGYWADDDWDGPETAGFPAVGDPETLCNGEDDDGDGVDDDGTCIYPEIPFDVCDGEDNDWDGVVDDGQCIDEDPVDGIDNDDDGFIDEDGPNITGWTLQNSNGANAQIVAGPDFCGNLDEVLYLGWFGYWEHRPNFDPVNWNEQCIVIRSTAAGETVVTAKYNVLVEGIWRNGETTNALIKEWDKFTDTVILKKGDVELVTLPSPPFASGTKVYLPKDADGNGKRNAHDEHLMDHNGETQEHPVMFDEALKRNRAVEGPIQLIDVVHGQHIGMPDHPSEGAVVLAFIDSPRGCTYFTNATGDIDGDGDRDMWDSYGTAVVGITDWRGFMIGPRNWPADWFTGQSYAQFTDEALAEAKAHKLEPGMSNNNLYSDLEYRTATDLGVYVDTLCEEQATITFKVGYPHYVQSTPEIPEPEWVRINWTTVEMAKQPLIRWAGEKIVLEKRWAPPGDWYPEAGAGIDDDGDTLINEDPGDDDGDGYINEEYPADGKDTDKDGNEDGTRAPVGFGNCNDGIDNDEDGKIDELDLQCAAFIDEDTGQNIKEDDDGDCVGDPPDPPAPWSDGMCSISGGIDEDGPDVCPLYGYLVKYSKLDGPGGLESGLPPLWTITPNAGEPDVVWTMVDEECVSRALYTSQEQGQVDVEATLHDWDYDWYTGEIYWVSEPFNEHAFLVWYLKIFQVKLTDIPLKDSVGRELHNAGLWGGESPLTAAGVTEETLNVSQDALLRVKVKGYFYGGNPSGRGDVCIDMDGDGDATDDDGDTLLNEDPADGVDNDGDTKVDEDTQVPGEPYKTTVHEGCKDADDHALDHGFWVLPDDMAKLAGPDPDRIATWDVMSEPTVAGEDLIGPKSTLDSHDDKLRRVVPCVVLKTRPDGTVEPDWTCLRKTVDPDGKITEADALMPPLKILAQIPGSADDPENNKDDDADTLVDEDSVGFLKMADKGTDVGIKSAYQRSMIPDSLWIPNPTNNCGYDWDSWGFYQEWQSWSPVVTQGPYEFFDILTKSEEFDALKRPYIRDFRFYTDNRGEGYFFANGDFKLTYDECPRQALSGTPDCKPGAVVGSSVINVIADYPYCRKHPAITSNPVTKTWEWGGFKSVTAERIDPTHTAIIAHLKDRDGYCKWSVGVDPTKKNAVVFSPSLNEVQHEWIEFLLNTDIGYIRAVSPNALYLGDVDDTHSIIDVGMPIDQVVKIKDHVSAPLAKERSTAATAADLEPGRAFRAEKAALARAEDVRVLAFYGKARGVDEDYVDPTKPDECQAWVIIEHPADQNPNVSVVFHDPEGQIDRHWPENELKVVLVPGWNDSCYTGPEVGIEQALKKADLIAEDGTSSVLAAYRFVNESQTWEKWFPGLPEVEDTLTTLKPFDQLFLLLDPAGEPKNWVMAVVAGADADNKDIQASLVKDWNSVCYAGADKSPDLATAGINGNLIILYTLANDQTWRRYVPNLEFLTNIVTLNQYTSVVLLMKNAAIWVFDP